MMNNDKKLNIAQGRIMDRSVMFLMGPKLTLQNSSKVC